MVVTFVMTNNRAQAAVAPSVDPVIINIQDSETNSFVTRTEVERLISGSLPEAGSPLVVSSVNTLELEQTLNGIGNIEWARCSRTSTDRLLIEVIPMRPVARVFDGDSSYYINRQGKRLQASLRYRSDVPVIQGHIADSRQAVRLLPLIDCIGERPELRELITSIRVTDNFDAILVPAIKGHVINFGTPDADIANKFDRLLLMYREVIPVKGWDFYDTLSVKFGHQVVATRRYPKKAIPTFIADTEGDKREKMMLDQLLSHSPDQIEPTQSPEATAPAEAAASESPAPASPGTAAQPQPEITEPDEPPVVIEQ